MREKHAKIIKLAVLGVTILSLIGAAAFLAAGLYYARLHTEDMGVTVVYARQFIPAGTVVSEENAASYIGIKRVAQVDLVPDAITLDGSIGKTPLLTALTQAFTEKPSAVPVAVLQSFYGLQAMTGVSENVQLEGKFFAQDNTASDERLFGIPMDYKLGLAGEIRIGDLVDLWVYRNNTGDAFKLYGNARIFKLKGESNNDIKPGSTEKPVLCIFKLTEDAIAQIRQAQGDGNVFLVKHGVEPGVLE